MRKLVSFNLRFNIINSRFELLIILSMEGLLWILGRFLATFLKNLTRGAKYDK